MAIFGSNNDGISYMTIYTLTFNRGVDIFFLLDAISFYRTINMKQPGVKVKSIIGKDVFHLII